MPKKRVVVICPGRGSYTKDTLGYLQSRGQNIQTEIIQMDAARKQRQLPTLTELDQEKNFKTSLHTKGEHASPLIYACSLADFKNIDQKNFEIVAVTGNSMGWYITLALSGALSTMGGFDVIQTMGGMMTGGTIGGQIIYPVVDENWQEDPQKRNSVLEVLKSVNGNGGQAYISIELGGYLVLGGDRKALQMLLKELPQEGDFPFQLINHGAFHTPLLGEVSKKGFEQLSIGMFSAPQIPMIDGRGVIWQPYSTDIKKLYNYTLGTQVVEPYNFTKAISTALKEFAPDHLMLLGPGNSLGGSLGQIMIKNQWKNIVDKESFSVHQKTESPTLVSLGLS